MNVGDYSSLFQEKIGRPIPGTKVSSLRVIHVARANDAFIFVALVAAATYVAANPRGDPIGLGLILLLAGAASVVALESAGRRVQFSGTPITVGHDGIKFPSDWIARYLMGVEPAVPWPSMKEMRIVDLPLDPQTGRRYAEVVLVTRNGRTRRSGPKMYDEMARFAKVVEETIPSLPILHSANPPGQGHRQTPTD